MRLRLTCCILAAATLATSAASAEAAADFSGVSASALAGYGTENTNLGLGARAGYTLPKIPVYVGGTLVYHFGASPWHLLYYGAEGGYVFEAGPVALRPFVGFGAATRSEDMGSSFTNVSVWPGLDILIPIASVFVGLDARYLIVKDNSSLGIFATGGLTF